MSRSARVCYADARSINRRCRSRQQNEQLELTVMKRPGSTFSTDVACTSSERNIVLFNVHWSCINMLQLMVFTIMFSSSQTISAKRDKDWKLPQNMKQDESQFRLTNRGSATSHARRWLAPTALCPPFTMAPSLLLLLWRHVGLGINQLSTKTAVFDIIEYRRRHNHWRWKSPSRSASRLCWLRRRRQPSLNRKQPSVHALRRRKSAGLHGEKTTRRLHIATARPQQCRHGLTRPPEAVWRLGTRGLVQGCQRRWRHVVVRSLASVRPTWLMPGWHQVVICRDSYSPFMMFTVVWLTPCTHELHQASFPHPRATHRSLRSPIMASTTPPPLLVSRVELLCRGPEVGQSHPGRCRQLWRAAAVRSTHLPACQCVRVVDHQRRLSSH